MSTPWLGIIADDVTGATDAAGYLVREGTSTLQYLGIPTPQAAVPVNVDCVVIALKTRSIPADDAVAQSLHALEWLLEHGVEHVFFKYCSTFDSTDAGNIGPVADALARRLDADRIVICPSAPENGRTVYKGKLFVWGALLEESPLRDHPLNPMDDSDLARLLGPQSAYPVRGIDWQQVARGAELLIEEIRTPTAAERTNVVIDALTDSDLDTIAIAALELGFSTGAAGLAAAIARRHGSTTRGTAFPGLPSGGSAVISGSCSSATRLQVAEFSNHHPSFEINPLALADDADAVLAQARAFLASHLGDDVPLVYSTAEPSELERVHLLLGAEVAAALVEDALGTVARSMRDLGVRRLVVAGGETSGAVTRALDATVLRIGAEVDPGVPWTVTIGEDPIALLLKSGNFGSRNFFSKALFPGGIDDSAR